MKDAANEALNLDQWYTPIEAAERLSKNSGKEIGWGYSRQLARLGNVHTTRLGRTVLYLRADIDAYVVEERGAKSGRAKQQRARK